MSQKYNVQFYPHSVDIDAESKEEAVSKAFVWLSRHTNGTGACVESVIELFVRQPEGQVGG